MDVETLSAKPRLRLLLDHFAKIKDTRQFWKVAYPLREVLFLVVCGTIASGDDYEDIVDWGNAYLSFLRGFAEFHFGIPCADWLRTVMNRINPDLFMACFTSWVEECWPDKPALVAIDGKTSRRSHNRKTGHKALHLVSTFATTAAWCWDRRRSLRNPTRSPPFRLWWSGSTLRALVSIDAMGCNPAIAQSILDAGADYLLAVKSLPPRRRGTTSRRFMPISKAISIPHRPRRSSGSRRWARTMVASRSAIIPSPRWSIGMPRSVAYPGAPRFPQLTTIAMVESRIERGDKIESERRSYISSRALSAAAFADAARGHWAIENKLHWTPSM